MSPDEARQVCEGFLANGFPGSVCRVGRYFLATLFEISARFTQCTPCETTYRFNEDHCAVFPSAMTTIITVKLMEIKLFPLVSRTPEKVVVGESWVGCFVAANGGTDAGIREMQYKEFQD